MYDIHKFSPYISIYQLVFSPVGLVLKFYKIDRRQIKCTFIYSRKVSTFIPVSIHETSKRSTETYVDFLYPGPTKSHNKF